MVTIFLLFCYCVYSISAITLSTGPITLQIDNSTLNCDFTIQFLDETWLKSGTVFITNNQTIHSSTNSLKLVSTSLNNEQDNKFGPYTRFTCNWQINDELPSELLLFSTSIIVYTTNPNLEGVIIFEQNFKSSISNTAQSSPWLSRSKCIPPVNDQCKGFDSVNSGFPTFQTNNGIFIDNNLRFIHWNGVQGNYCHFGHKNEFYYPPRIGQGFWGSYNGGSPLILFNENPNLNYNAQNILILSQLNHFKTSTFAMTDNNQLSSGIGGLTDSVLNGTIHRTMLYGSIGIKNNILQKSIADVMFNWGDIMLFLYNKKRKSLQESKDLSISHLGYWADNGAYYCLISESNNSMNISYQQTMIDIASYLDNNIKIPITYFQLDWGWYYPQCFRDFPHQKCPGWSVLNWTADTYDKSMFPNGLQWLYKQLSTNKYNNKLRGFDLHNRQWHPINYYSENNEFEWIIEGDWIDTTSTNSVGLPKDTDLFFYSLYRNASKWGLWIYEKDYLLQQFQGMFTDFGNLTFYESYLQSMSDMALKACSDNDIECGNNDQLTIQFCTASPTDIVSAIQFDQVTQVRVSTDYMAGSQQPGGAWNWHIGKTSLLTASVGLAPFKDNFWTTQYQTGNPWHVNEPNPGLNALIASLSNGPVGIGDKIGDSNKTIIMRVCRDDGLLLKSDRSILPIDRVFTSNTYTNSTRIWYSYSTYNVNNANFTWFYLLIADVYDTNYYLTYSDLGPLSMQNNIYKNYLLTPLNITYNIGIYNKYNSGKYIWNNLEKLNLDKMINTTKVYKNGFVPQKVPYQYYILSPQLDINNNWYLIGEYTKYITMSYQRFKLNHKSNIINVTNNSLTINVEGIKGETIFIKTYYNPTSTLLTQSCTVTNPDTNICQIMFQV